MSDISVKNFHQDKESIVLAGDKPEKLRYNNVVKGSLVLKHIFHDGSEKVFTEGKDYTVDYEKGEITRTENSEIEDFAGSVFYGQDDFFHEGVPDFTSTRFMSYASYDFDKGEQKTPVEYAKARFDELGFEKISFNDNLMAEFKSRPLRLAVLGDSISTGADALFKEDGYPLRIRELISQKLNVDVELINFSVGGDTSETGLSRYLPAVEWKPDIATIAFSINDQIFMDGRHFVTPDAFEKNIEKMVKDFLEAGSRVVLVSSCDSHPNWRLTSGKMDEYTEKLKLLCKRYDLTLADVNHLWRSELAEGKSHESLLDNNINHPTSYGHRIYKEAFDPIF